MHGRVTDSSDLAHSLVQKGSDIFSLSQIFSTSVARVRFCFLINYEGSVSAW